MPDTRPGPLDLLSKSANRIRTRGPKEAVELGLRRLAEAIRSADTLIMFVRDAGGAGDAAEGLRFREATAGDAVDYAARIGTDSARTFRARLSDLTRCFVVLLEGRLAHATWVTTGTAWTRELSRYVVPPRTDAYIYESFTRADARGRGIYPFALRNICAALGREGVGKTWVAVEADNPASIRSVTKAGFEPTFEIAYERSWGRLSIGPITGPEADRAAGFLSEVPEAPGL